MINIEVGSIISFNFNCYERYSALQIVLTHGFVVDEEGKKMSKSIGNVITPQEVIDQSGADILRFWIASTDFRGEMAFSKDILNNPSTVSGAQGIQCVL